MKYIFTSLFFSLSLMLQAQAVADFTLTDIDGTSHNLYTYLNEGKTVVLHFANTDCGDCWAFHQTQNMSIANDIYGPTGTDDMVFLLLETDSITTMSSLQGSGFYTKGDWITGTSHPIIDGAENVAADYNITELPTVIAICADTTSTDLYTAGYPTPSDMYIAHEVCTPANTANDMTIIDVLNDDFCGTLKSEVLIMNTGTEVDTIATFIISTGTEVETISWSGNIAPNEYTTLTLGTALTEATTEVTVTIQDVNDTPDGSSFTKTMTQAEPHCVQKLTITVITDNFGCETLWTMNGLAATATGGNTNATAGNRTIEYDDLTGACSETGYDSNTSYTVTYPSSGNIVSGCYEFHILDDWGDGMCCEYGEGSYTIADQDGNVLATGGNFGAEEIVSLNIRLAVSGGTIVSPDLEICIDSTLILTTNSPVIDTVRGFTNIAWGTWILNDPLGQSTIPTGGLPNDEFPDDDPNFAGYWQDANEQTILGESIQIFSDSSAITYYIAPLITNTDIEFDTQCTGLNPAQGYTVFMNPQDSCKGFVVDIELPVPTTNISINPNPAQDYFQLNFDLKGTDWVSIYLHNIMGQEVKYLPPTHYNTGENAIQIETVNLPSGMYIATLQTEKGSISKKITITRP